MAAAPSRFLPTFQPRHLFQTTTFRPTPSTFRIPRLDSLTTQNNKPIMPPLVVRASLKANIETWADQQTIFVGAATVGLYEAGESFLIGLCSKIFINRFFPHKLSNVPLPNDMPFSSLALYPLVFCNQQSPIRYAILYATFLVLMEIAKYVVKRLRGKQDLKASVLEGFAQGMFMCLITGGRRFEPCIIVCVVYAVIYALMFKTLRPKKQMSANGRSGNE